MSSETIGPYKILSQLGLGGMGTVYEGLHVELGRRAAVKVLHPQYSGNQALVRRFFHEAKAAAMIDHAGIVTVYEFGFDEIDDRAYIAMELLRGETLRQRFETKHILSEAEAVSVGRQIATALGAAHAAGIVHRDLKPENVYLVPDADVVGGERVKLLDFGIAKLSDDLRDKGHTTKSGVFMGTPAYASPEQCDGARTLGPPSDLYSLGCILYHAVCGRPPFVAEGVGRMIAAHIYERPVPAATYNPEISPGLRALLDDLLAKEPERRPDAATASARMRSLGAPSIQGPAAHRPPIRQPSAPVITGTEPTTLGAAAGQTAGGVSNAKRNWLIGAGLAVLVAATASVAAIAASSSGDPPEPPETEVTKRGDPQSKAGPAATPGPSGARSAIAPGGAPGAGELGGVSGLIGAGRGGGGAAGSEPATDRCAFDNLVDLRTRVEVQAAIGRLESCKSELAADRYKNLKQSLTDQLEATVTGLP